MSAKFRRLLFEIDLGFLGTRAEIVKYTQLVSGRESWEILFPILHQPDLGIEDERKAWKLGGEIAGRKD